MKALTLTLLAENQRLTNVTQITADVQLSKQAKYLAIAEALRLAIKQGQVAPTEALPSARKLAQQLDVNRHTVMAALAELVAQGWVEAKRTQWFIAWLNTYLFKVA